MTLPPALPPVHWPVLELLVDPGGAEVIAPLVKALQTLVRPVAPDHSNHVAARLLSSPRSADARRAARDTHIPFAVVVRGREDLDDPVCRAATALVVIDGDDLATAAGDRGIAMSAHPVAAREMLPVPHDRRGRLAADAGLPYPFVLAIGRPGAPALTDRVIATGLRLATVVDVCGPWAVHAMALGAPVVTDTATATLLGAVDGEHVIVADAARSAGTARRLAADPVRCAQLARAGRTLVEQRHDPALTARTLVARLGITAPMSQPTAVGVRVTRRLQELGTPSLHPVERQMTDRLASLGVTVRSGGMS